MLDLKDLLIRQAAALGFDSFRITSPQAIAHAEPHLRAYLEAGYHGSMGWMEQRAQMRANPTLLWPDVKSILLLGLNYGPDHNPLERLGVRSHGLVSAYAQGADYHNVIKPRLKTLAGFLNQQTGGEAKVFVDTAPVMEKPLAQAAGLGWQGKHTVLVSRAFGSWLFLGAIYTNVALDIDAPEAGHCGSCTKCLSICPTNAFPAPYQLDSRRCISYLTIEHKGPIPRELRPAFGNRIFGCDDCLAVCPWNKFAQDAREQVLFSRRDIGLMPLGDLLALDDAAFRALFAKTPVKRTGRARFIRNCLIAAGNSGDLSLLEAVRTLLDDSEPLVRGAAVWALQQLSREALRQERWRISSEIDAGVQEEWVASAL